MFLAFHVFSSGSKLLIKKETKPPGLIDTAGDSYSYGKSEGYPYYNMFI